MKLLDLFDFCKKFYFCIFDHFLRTIIWLLRIEVANFVQKLTLFTGVQKSRITKSAPLVRQSFGKLFGLPQKLSPPVKKTDVVTPLSEN